MPRLDQSSVHLLKINFWKDDLVGFCSNACNSMEEEKKAEKIGFVAVFEEVEKQ